MRNINYYDVLIGQRMKEERLKRKMSLAECGKLFDVSRQSIFFYERGERGMSAETLFKMLNYYGIDADQFIKEIIKEADESSLIY